MAGNDEAQIRCRFEFACPQQRSRLQPTEKEDVRHCAECNRDVHLTLTEADVRQHSDEGRCIAVPVSRERGESRAEEREYVVGMVETPYRSE